MADDLSDRRYDVMYGRLVHPQGNKLSAAESVEFMIGTAERVFPFLRDEDVATLQAEIVELRADEAMRVAAGEAVRRRSQRFCEMFREATDLGRA